MSMRRGRLAVVTSRFPFGSQESYLAVELAELARYFDEVFVVPVRPPQSAQRYDLPPNARVLAWPLLSGEILRRALRSLATRPRRAGNTVRALASSRDPGRWKNGAVLIKGLALGHWATEAGIDHIHAYWMSTPSTVAMIAGLASGVPWSATAHRWDIYERNAFDVKERSIGFVRAISERGARALRARMPSLNGRVRHLPLGIAVPPYAERSRRGDEFAVACPAALVEVKGHSVLFRALAQLRRSGVPVRCTLYGSGPLEQQLQAEAAALGISGAVEFAGFVPQSRLHDAYRADRFHAVVLASRADGETMMEGVPSALLEAMAFGVPVVATDSGSVAEAIDSASGSLVAPDDPNALAAALLDVYRDPDGARVRARQAYDAVTRRHDVRTQMHDLAAVIRGKEPHS